MVLSKSIRLSISVVSASVITAGLSLILVFGTEGLFQEAIDIQLHDTYFVMAPLVIFIYLFLGFAFLISLFLQIFFKYRRKSLNIILVIVSSILLFSFIIVYSNMFLFAVTLSDKAYPNFLSKIFWSDLSKLLIGVIFFLSLTTGVTIFRMIRNHRKKKLAS